MATFTLLPATPVVLVKPNAKLSERAGRAAAVLASLKQRGGRALVSEVVGDVSDACGETKTREVDTRHVLHQLIDLGVVVVLRERRSYRVVVEGDAAAAERILRHPRIVSVAADEAPPAAPSAKRRPGRPRKAR